MDENKENQEAVKDEVPEEPAEDGEVKPETAATEE